MKKAVVFASCLVLGALGLSANEWTVTTNTTPMTFSDGNFTFKIDTIDAQNRFKLLTKTTPLGWPSSPSVLDFRGTYKDSEGNDYFFYNPLVSYPFASNKSNVSTAFRNSVSKIYLPEVGDFVQSMVYSYGATSWQNLQEVVIPSTMTNFPESSFIYLGSDNAATPWRIVFEAGCLHGTWGDNIGIKPGKHIKIVFAGHEDAQEGDWYIGTDGEPTVMHNSAFEAHTFKVTRFFVGPRVRFYSGYMWTNKSGDARNTTCTVTNIIFTGAKPASVTGIRPYNGLEHKCCYYYPRGADGWADYINANKLTTTNQTLATKISEYQAIFGTAPEAQPEVWVKGTTGNTDLYFPMKSYRPVRRGLLLILR